MLIDRPWTRVRTPVLVPEDVSAARFAAMTDLDLAQMLRSQLVPRDQSREGRRAWEQMWETLRTDDGLAERAFDILEEFLDATEEALETGLNEDQQRRATKFLEQCRGSWKRLERAPSNPQHARATWRTTAALVEAIAAHREAVLATPGEPRPEDEHLWAAPRRLGLGLHS
jgi:hypothetical protein